MSMQDPVADMLTRIRNAQSAYKKEVSIPLSKHKLALANLLKDEGYVIHWDQCICLVKVQSHTPDTSSFYMFM